MSGLLLVRVIVLKVATENTLLFSFEGFCVQAGSISDIKTIKDNNVLAITIFFRKKWL